MRSPFPARSRAIVLFCGLLLLAAAWRYGSGGGAQAAAAPVADGGFEAGGTGWTLSDARVIDVAGAPQGNRVLELDPGERTELKAGRAVARAELELGREYELAITFQAGYVDPNVSVAITLNGDTTLDVLTMIQPQTPDPARDTPDPGLWRRRAVRFIAAREDNEIGIGPISRYREDFAWGKFWVDRVTLRPTTPGPVRPPRLGEEIQALAVLPSEAVVGAAVPLRVSLLWAVRSTGMASHFQERPVPWTGEVAVEGDALDAPLTLAFDASSAAEATVRFTREGVHRLVLRGPEGEEVRTNPVRVTAEPVDLAHRWGDVHIHTSAGHASWYGGDGEHNYHFARDRALLDFAALSEHYGMDVTFTWLDQLVPATLAYDRPGSFATLIGVETGDIEGHFNFYLRGDDPLEMFDNRSNFDLQEQRLRELRSRGVYPLMIPHHFMLLEPVDWRVAARDLMRVGEIYSTHGSSERAGIWWRHPTDFANSYEDSKGAKGHDYLSALAHGQRLGVVGSSDSHFGRPGLSGLTCALVPALTRSDVYDAIHARRCYATTGTRILLDVDWAGAAMGAEAFREHGTPLVANLAVHGTDLVERVEIVRDGEVVRAFEPLELDFTTQVDLGPYDGRPTWAYVRVLQRDEHRAWTSPIWIDPTGSADLAVETEDIDYDFDTSTLRVRPRNFGDAAVHARVTIRSAEKDGRIGRVLRSLFDRPQLVLRLVPGPGDARWIEGAFLTPLGFSEAYTLEGRIAAVNGTCTVADDPRGMMRVAEDGTITWADEFGYYFRFSQSKAGWASDFRLLVDGGAGAELEVGVTVDGEPIPVWYGRTRFEPADRQVLSIAPVAPETIVAQQEARLDPRLPPLELAFPGIPKNWTYLVLVESLDDAVDWNARNNAWAFVPSSVGRTVQHFPDYEPKR